jgi:ribonuclease P protein component
LRITTLKQRSSFLLVGRQGVNIKTPGFIFRALEYTETPLVGCGVGFTVTKKVGNAVVRNRIKRRLRAAVREVFPHHAKENYSYVLIGRRSILHRNYQDLLGDLVNSLKKTHET